MKTNFNEIAAEIHAAEVKKGFYDTPVEIGTALMCVVSELSEALAAERKGAFRFNRPVTIHPATLEEWRDIAGHETYQVSNFGRVRSKSRKVWNGKTYYTKEGRILSPGLGGTGYYTVAIDGKTHKIARLVAKAFVDGWFNGAVVNHIDGCKTNDNAGNLEWVSCRDNNVHAIETGLSKHRQKLPYWDRVDIAHLHKSGHAYTEIAKLKDWGISDSAIQRICNESEKYTDSFEMEIADAIIWLLDIVGWLGIDIDSYIKYKLKYNATRGYKHGKKY